MLGPKVVKNLIKLYFNMKDQIDYLEGQDIPPGAFRLSKLCEYRDKLEAFAYNGGVVNDEGD
jgi:hypothetical protein